MVKYIESVFNLSSSLSSTLTGLIVVPAAVLGTFTGGYLVRRYHMGILQCSQLILISCLLSWLGLFGLVFVRCPTTKIDRGLSPCSTVCHCSPIIYEPVCYQHEITYLSACHAGCATINGTVSAKRDSVRSSLSRFLCSKDYLDCKCLKRSAELRRGSCRNVCSTETCLFLLILFTVTFCQTLMATPQLIVVLRSVQHELQSFALGLENCLIKLLAQIPGPIVFGILIDNQCLLWSRTSCHRRGSCFIYDGKRLPTTLFGTAIVIKGFSLMFVVVLLWVTERRRRATKKSNELGLTTSTVD